MSFHALVTTDVHSEVSALAKTLSHATNSSPPGEILRLDAGDFFEGNLLYASGSGAVECEVVRRHYDYVAVGNHGYKHYRNELREKTICCNIVHAASRERLFTEKVTLEHLGVRILLTAAITPEAFSAIPRQERQSDIAEPVHERLAEMISGDPHDLSLVLSHAGWEADTALAQSLSMLPVECPIVIFSGHCHSANYGPAPFGNVQLVKGKELGKGAVSLDWRPGVRPSVRHVYGALDQVSPEYDWISQEADIGHSAATILGRVKEAFSCNNTAASGLREALIADLVARYPSSYVLLNVPALRDIELGTVLSLEDLYRIEPFGNSLCQVRVSSFPWSMVRMAGHRYGDNQIRVPSHERSQGDVLIITTDYLAQNLLSLGTRDYSRISTMRDVVAELILDVSDVMLWAGRQWKY